MIKKIITDETLPNDLKSDGEILFGSDLGYLISVLKTAVNWNRDDLIRIITGDTDISVAYQDYSTGKTDAQILAEEAGSSGSKLIFFKQDSESEDGFVALYIHNGTSWVKQYEVDFIKLKEDMEQAIADFESGARAFTGFSIDDGSGNVATLVYTHTNGNHYQVLDILYPDGRRAQINEEIYVNYRNATGTLLNSGYVLMGDGTTQGTQAPNGFLFNELSPNAYNILGVTTIDAVTSGSKSKATKLGIVTSIDVADLYTTGTAYAEGQIVWARGGKLSNVAPAKPGLQVRMGLVINVLGNKVDVMVCPQIFQKLTDSSDVVITNIQSGHTIRYDGTKFINIMDNASNTPYSNTSSLLSSTNVQAAIDELQANKVGKTTTIAGVNLQDSITQSELKAALDIDDLESNKVDKTTTVAGVDLQNSITPAELKVALDIDDLEANKVDKTTTIAGVNLVDNITPAELKVALDVDDLESNKVDKTTTIIGIDLADNITLSEFKIALGEATTALSGLMSPTDKARLNALHAVFGESADADAVVNTINEILAVFANYPEGQEVIASLNSKVDKVTGKSLVADTEIAKLIALDNMTTLQGKIDAKANTVDVYTKLETYTRNEIDSKDSLKANISDVYTKGETYTRNEIDTKDSLKANASDVYTKAETYTTTQVDTIIEDIAPSKGIQSTLLTPSELQNGGTITTSLLTQNLNFIVLVVTNQDTGEVDSDVVSASSIVVGKKFVFFDNENVYFTIGTTNSTFTENGNYSLKINALITSDAVQASDIVYDHFLSGLVATNTQAAIDEVDGIIDTHLGNTSNPHSVTKTQVGLGNVENYGISTQLEAQTGTSNVKYMTPLRTAEAIAQLAPAQDLSAYDAHVASTSNPHGVTKTQVGLGNVDNTSDLNKPISTATQTALDGKSDTTHTHTFDSLTSKPTTIEGYGITDAYTKTETDTQISTAVSNLVDTAPTTLDTLNELAAALGDNPSFATDVAASIGTKVTSNPAITGATKTKITYDSKGLVTSGADAGIADITGLQTALDGKAASSHTHGSITNDGKIGTTANLIVQTGTGGALTAKAAGTTAQFLRGDGSWATPPDTNTIYTHPSSGANTTITAANGKVLSSITVDSLGHTTAVGSKTLAAADIPNLDTSKLTTGTLGVARGGTGATTFTSGNVLVGNGTSAVTTLSRSGIDSRTSFPPSAHSTDLLTSGTLGVARGGTGRTDGYAVGVVETRASVLTKIWTGTQAQYDAIGTKDANTLYFIM